MSQIDHLRRMRDYSPAQLLLLIRNHIVVDWTSACVEFHLDPEKPRTAHLELHRDLESLRDAGLVHFEGRYKDIRKIEVSPYWEKIQTSLGISLTQLAGSLVPEAMVVKPYFGLSTAPSMKSDIFVLMPFIDSLNHVYRDHISKVAENLALQIARADDFFTANTIMADIWNAICDAQLVIADCTGRNPNAFYEIGLAHTIGKQAVLIT